MFKDGWFEENEVNASQELSLSVSAEYFQSEIRLDQFRQLHAKIRIILQRCLAS